MKAAGNGLLLLFKLVIAHRKIWQYFSAIIGLLQQTITWYKIRRTGGQAHYYSRSGTFKQRPVKLDWLSSLVLTSQCGNNNELALQYGGFCTMRPFIAKGLLSQRLIWVKFVSNTKRKFEMQLTIHLCPEKGQSERALYGNFTKIPFKLLQPQNNSNRLLKRLLKQLMVRLRCHVFCF